MATSAKKASKKKTQTQQDFVRMDNESPASAINVDEAEKAQETHLHFFGSETLRERLPKTFQLAEAVATDWKKDGPFEKLPIEQPLLAFAAQRGLLKAKEIEKKLDEKGVFMFAKIGLEYAKTKWTRR